MKLLNKIIQKVGDLTSGQRMTPVSNASISNNQIYPQACIDATIDLESFKNFRRNPVYNQVLEHVSFKHGCRYLDLIKDDKNIVARMEEFRKNDLWGNPVVYEFPEIGKFSPTTLRYIKVLKDIKDYFHSVDGFKVFEIGVGYGGQCRILNAYFQPSEYHLADIEPALGLAGRYLDNFVLHSRVKYVTMNELKETDCDLLISNYAFTELSRELQDVYLKKVISKSRRGYITYNEITPPEFNSYKLGELLETIPGSKTIEERPHSGPNNCIIVWGHKTA